MSKRSEVVLVERLTLISRVGWLELAEPIIVRAGDRYWADFDERVVVVETSAGGIQRLRAKPFGPDSIRQGDPLGHAAIRSCR